MLCVIQSTLKEESVLGVEGAAGGERGQGVKGLCLGGSWMGTELQPHLQTHIRRQVRRKQTILK